MAKEKVINVQGQEISVSQIREDDYICLTDMVKAKGSDFFITDWLRNKNTLEFLSVWETMYNPDFNYGEFAIISHKSGLNTFKVSVKEWVERTKAIGITAKAGKYGGTYAHKDIAFEFGSWISPTFKLYLIKEFQRLKEIENNQYDLEWNVKRMICKANYKIHTDTIKSHVIPTMNIDKDKEGFVYANEADLLNAALFGCTAKQWKEANTSLALKGYNVRDIASINELTILSNMESINAQLMKQGVDKKARFLYLQQMAREQLKSIEGLDFIKTIRRLPNETYADAENLYSEKKKLVN